MYRHQIDGVSFFLREPCDLSFLAKYGTAFCVFDRNISGNIGFGMDDGKTRRFVKIAGLPTARYQGKPVEAVQVLRRAAGLYHELSHPHLIQLEDAYKKGPLFVAVFPWESGECLYDHWNFELYRTHPEIRTPAARFRALPLRKRMEALEILLSFLRLVSEHGYAAVDYYDGSILYDFEKECLHICDIDFFEKFPYVNTRGLMWGDDKFRAPEEYSRGAVLDDATNVYRAGALMFYCLADPGTRDPSTWTASHELYEIARRATSPSKADRYPSVAALMDEWEKAKGR